MKSSGRRKFLVAPRTKILRNLEAASWQVDINLEEGPVSGVREGRRPGRVYSLLPVLEEVVRVDVAQLLPSGGDEEGHLPVERALAGLHDDVELLPGDLPHREGPELSPDLLQDQVDLLLRLRLSLGEVEPATERSALEGRAPEPGGSHPNLRQIKPT